LASELALSGADRILSILPNILLKRIYSKSRLDREVLIDTRTTNPIIFSLGTYIPVLRAWFTLTNFSNLTWRVQDFFAEIWIGQPLAVAICFDKPLKITRKSKCEVFTKCILNELQVVRLREIKEKQNDAAIATIYIYALLESKIGPSKFEITLENRHVIIE